MPIPGRENDAETGMEDFDIRLWDARNGRWLTTDPAVQYNSLYLGMGNNPVIRVDLVIWRKVYLF